jgi:hypothetical protein
MLGKRIYDRKIVRGCKLTFRLYCTTKNNITILLVRVLVHWNLVEKTIYLIIVSRSVFDFLVNFLWLKSHLIFGILYTFNLFIFLKSNFSRILQYHYDTLTQIPTYSFREIFRVNFFIIFWIWVRRWRLRCNQSTTTTERWNKEQWFLSRSREILSLQDTVRYVSCCTTTGLAYFCYLSEFSHWDFYDTRQF